MSPSTNAGSGDVAARLSEALLRGRADAILATDHEGSIAFWNPGAARIFGYSAEEALGRSLDIIIPEGLRQRHWRGYGHAMASGTSRYAEGDLLSAPALHKDGRRISVEFTIVMLRNAEGRISGIGAVVRDVTPRFEELKALRRRLSAGDAPCHPPMERP